MNDTRSYAFYAGCSAAFVEAALTVTFVFAGGPWGIPFAFMLTAALVAAFTEWRYRRGHRRTEGDHRSGDTDGAAVGASGGTSTHVTLPNYGSLFNTYYRATFSTSTNPGEGTGTDALANLPRRKSDEPITAWKHATVVLDNGKPYFRGIGMHGLYSADDHARCASSLTTLNLKNAGFAFPVKKAHKSPKLDCRCGFYGMASQVREVPCPPTVLLEVEFYGTVIACERGYRAERQRVLGVYVPSQCANALCQEHAVQFAFLDPGVGYGLCEQHGQLVPSTPLLTPASLSDLSGALGTEVRWADELPSPVTTEGQTQ